MPRSGTAPTRTLNWAILGTGSIAVIFASALAKSPRARLLAAGSRRPERPEHAASFPGVRMLSYAEIIAAEDIDVVHIALPHSEHASWALAYVLQQRLPAVPVIGPLTLDELADSLKATGIRMSAEDIAWLEG